jgi:hypothetical protein
MAFGLAASAFGIVTRSTPFSNVASTLSTSTPRGSVMAR